MNAIAEKELMTTWNIDSAHTQAEFVVKHMMFAKVRGRFAEVAGTISLGAEGDLATGKVSVEIGAASVDTSQQQRDEHLRSADFFDVEQFPKLTFRSTHVERVGDDSFRLRGELTIRDITREVELDVTETGKGTDPWGNERVGFHAETVIDRKDFGLTWNQALEAGGVLVGTDVEIALEVQAVLDSE